MLRKNEKSRKKQPNLPRNRTKKNHGRRHILEYGGKITFKRVLNKKRGGSVGNTEATFYLFAFPNHMNPEETIPYYEVKQTNLKDVFNLGATDNLFRGMVTNTPMRSYSKTFSMEQN